MSVSLYTSNSCAYCTMVKKLFKYKGVDYIEKNIDDNPEYGKEAIKLSGQLAVPVVVSGTDVVVGWNPVRLSSLIASTQIDIPQLLVV